MPRQLNILATSTQTMATNRITRPLVFAFALLSG
jgi:hypothetical protein